MPHSRRRFLRNLAGGVAAIPVIADLGHEASTGAPPRTAGRIVAGKIRLDSNENPSGPSEAALKALRAALSEAGRYPDRFEDELTAAIAAQHGVAEDHVLIGCGSTEHLRLCVDAFANRGAGVVTAAPSFEITPRHAQRQGIPVAAVPVDGGLGLDLVGMLDQSVGAGLVYLCNPNNPTGTVLGRASVEEFIEKVHGRSPSATVLVDEAYFEYVDEPGYGTLIPMALADPRVIVLRTLSKVHGMAGLRIGYAIARAETIHAMAAFRLNLSVNALGAAAAVASLADAEHLDRERRRNREARAYTRKFFERAGFTVVPSHTNFVMVDVRRPIEEFREACSRRDVLIGRPFPPLRTHARISIATLDEMRQAVRVFGEVLGARAE